MARKWGLLNKDVHMRIPGARQTLENFRQERKTLVSEVIEVACISLNIAVYILMYFAQNAAQCERWFKIITEERIKDGRNKSNNRYHACVLASSARIHCLTSAISQNCRALSDLGILAIRHRYNSKPERGNPGCRVDRPKYIL